MEVLFDAYAFNLEMYQPEYKGLFACPLCLGLFNRQALQAGAVAVEHIVPSSIGGRLTTLTCRQCNNRAGTELEADLVQELRTDDILRGNVRAPLRGQISVGEGEQTADVYLFDQGKLSIHVDGLPKYSDPDKLAKVISAFESGAREVQFRFNLGYRQMDSRVAKIRMAYLMMFRYFGYGYIAHPNLEQIRDLIQEPKPDSPIFKGLIQAESPTISNCVGLVKSPEEVRSFVVILDVSTETERYLGMLLPGLDEAAGELYDKLEQRTEDGLRSEQIDVRIFEWTPEYLTNPIYMGFPYQAWIGNA